MGRTSTEDNNQDTLETVNKRLKRVEEYLLAQKTNFDEQEKVIKKNHKIDLFLMPQGTWFGTEYK